MNRPTFQPMDPKAVLEIIDAIRQIVEKHHGKGDDTMQLTDYAAVAMMAFADMGIRDNSRAERDIAMDMLAGNLKRMCRRVAESGFKGIMGGPVR